MAEISKPSWVRAMPSSSLSNPPDDGGITMAEDTLPRIEPCIVQGREFARITVDGKAFLVSPKCPHRGTPITEATVIGDFLVCSRHRATFDLRTGGWVRGPRCANISVKALTDGGSVS